MRVRVFEIDPILGIKNDDLDYVLSAAMQYSRWGPTRIVKVYEDDDTEIAEFHNGQIFFNEEVLLDEQEVPSSNIMFTNCTFGR